jgi:hypothetical protein
VIDLLAALVVILGGSAAAAIHASRYTKSERPYLLVSFAAHVASAFGQIALVKVYYTDGGDMINYMSDGTAIARLLELDFKAWFPYWVDLLLGREAANGVLPVLGAGSSTGSTSALTAALAIVFFHSIYGITLFIACCAYFGKTWLYNVLRESLPHQMRPRLLVAVLLVPSLVFWSCGILKESFAIIGVGAFCLGIHRFLREARLRGLIYLAAGATLIALVKPYILFALVLAGSTWIYAESIYIAQGRQGIIKVRPLYFVVSAVIAFAALAALMRAFPEFSVDNLGNDFARYQAIGASEHRGAAYSVGDAQTRSLGGQLLFTPVALTTSLFRPFFFEVRSPVAVAAAVETLVVTLYFLSLCLRTPGKLRLIMSRPVLAAAVVFTLAFGTAVGLATSNFGTLSRYRMPLMPFYALVLLVLTAPDARRLLIGGVGASGEPSLPPGGLGSTVIRRNAAAGRSRRRRLAEPALDTRKARGPG